MKTNSPIKITDLIGEAVTDAAVRRSQVEPSELSGAETENVKGGLSINPKILGYFPPKEATISIFGIDIYL